MITDTQDFFHKNKTYFSVQEERFKQTIQSTFGLTVRQTCPVTTNKGKQFCPHIWFDLPTSFKINRMTGIHKEDNELVCSHKQLISMYLDVFQVDSNRYEEYFVELYDYHTELVKYAYGHAILSLRQLMHDRYGCVESNVCLNYAGPALVLIGSAGQCRRWERRRDKMECDCLAMLKQYDGQGELTSADVRLHFWNESRTDPYELNILHMTNGI